MKSKLAVSVVFVLVVACIGWNSDQKEVIEDYNALIRNTGEENWSSLLDGLSDQTVQLLDEIAGIYTEAGAPFDNEGEKLLASIVSETDFLELSDVILSVEFRNEKAYLTSGQGDAARSYRFVRQGGHWKLDLVSELSEYIGEVTGVPDLSSGEQSFDPSATYISVGNGNCEFALRNDLDHLSVWGVYCSPSDSDSWGEDWLGSSILGGGAEMGIWLEPGVYDIQLLDSEENTYTLWQVELDEQGVFWPVTDLDRDEP